MLFLKGDSWEFFKALTDDEPALTPHGLLVLRCCLEILINYFTLILVEKVTLLLIV